MLVTTSGTVNEQIRKAAESTALQFGWAYVARGEQSLSSLRAQAMEGNADPQMLVLTHAGWRWYPGNHEDAIFFHPSMAYVRLKRLARGESDVLLQIADIRSGETIVDCTAGMASDSLVLAFAAGATGRVIAVESTEALAFLIREGLKTYRSPLPALLESMQRIQVVKADHRTFLKDQPDGSADVVYFDPMFRSPLKDANVIDPLRGAVNHQALEISTIEEAKRVARRLIVMKEAKHSAEFERLGFEIQKSGSGKISYGVIRL